jgi:hypothetical protein
MTLIKKILSIILAMIICLTSVPFAFATDEVLLPEDATQQEDTVIPDDNISEDNNIPDEETTAPEEEPTVPDAPPAQPEEIKPLQDNDVVADIYVFYDKSDIHGAGHTWIYVENLTDQNLKVGAYTLPPNEGVSVGTLPEYDGWGLYYNIEAYQQGIYGMEDQLSMKDQITLKKLRRVSSFIVSYPNFWDPVFFNCMLFAFLAWDMGSWKILIPLFFPIIGKIQMLIYPHETGTLMKPVTKDKVYRQTGMFGWAGLMPYDT